MKYQILILSIGLSFFLSCKDSKKDSSRFSSQEIEKMRLELENKSLLKFEGFEVSEYDAKFLDSISGVGTTGIESFDGDFVPSAFSQRIYPGKGIEDYREDLTKLVGLIATKSGDDYSVGIRSYIHDSIKVEQKVPTNGKLVERKLEKKDEKKLGWILSVELEDTEILRYSIEDQARAIITEKHIDFEKIDAVFDSKLAQNKFLIVLATSTEIMHSKHTKKGRRIKFDEIPVLGSAFSANSNIYVSEESMQRDYKVGLRLVPVSDLLN